MHSIIPHLLLPPALFLPFYLPSFPFRNVIFGTATIGIIACNAVNTYPDASTLRYGLSGAWIIYFPVLEKLLLHPDPEHDFWRLDRRPHEADYMGPFSRTKARWAAALISSPRGVGWSHGSKKIPSGPERSQGRGRFVLDQVRAVALSVLALEAILILRDNMSVPDEWAARQLPTIVSAVLLMGSSVYVTWTAQYCAIAGLSVGAGLSRPKDWPPIFGSIRDATTLAGFWGSFWHGILRQPSLGFSKALVKFIGLPPGTNIAYVVHITVAFFFSSFWHVLGIATLAEDHISLTEMTWRLSVFFLSQIPVIAAEHALMSPRMYHTKKNDGKNTRLPPDQRDQSPSRRILGYACVFTWLGLSGWLFVTVYKAVGLVDTDHPFPVIRPLLGWFNIQV